MTIKEMCEKHPSYRTWIGMKSRCYGNNAKNGSAYRYYQERGILICDEWLDFYVFEKWALDHGWKNGLHIHRIDRFGNYAPENCEFLTPTEHRSKQKGIKPTKNQRLWDYKKGLTNYY